MSILQLEGAYENELAATGEFNPNAPKTALMLPSGQRLVLPTEVLLRALEGRPAEDAALSVPVAEPLAAVQEEKLAAPTPAVAGGEQVISLVAEAMHVAKAQVETGRVRVRRETEEHLETVNVPLTDVRWEIEHVPVEQKVAAQPEIRQVGETIIFPLVEERMVVTRELWLKEEVHVRKVMSTVEKSTEFSLKRDVLVESRTGEA